MAHAEQDLRLNILNTLLTTPHRALAALWPVHRDLAQQDPRFYVRLAAWYADHGDVRDHKEMFVVTLVLSDFDGHREVGLAMLRGMPPYQVVRVVDFINGRKESIKVKVEDPTKPVKAKKGKSAVVAATVETVDSKTGLFRNPPRSLRTEIVRYLREREADADWFDSSVLVARKAVKRLYALLHVKPSPRAQQILFDEEPPANSKLFALKELAKATNPKDQADAIMRLKVPFRVASTVIAKMTPEVLAALVTTMSAQELINNLAALKRKGAFDVPAVKTLIDERLTLAKSATRVSALKADVAKDVAGSDPELAKKLDAVADAQIKAKGRIVRPTALLIDKSSSMSVAIELGKRIGAIVSAVCEKELYVYAFDTLAYPVERAGDDLASWEKSLRGITAGGSTSCGVALDWMRRKRQAVEQIVLITDEEENTAPLFTDALQKYRQEMLVEPNVCIVRTPGGSSHLEAKCRQAGISADVFQFSGDYYSLPNLIPMLARPSKLELLMEILEYPLPERRA